MNITDADGERAEEPVMPAFKQPGSAKDLGRDALRNISMKPEETPCPVICVSPEGRILQVNRAGREALSELGCQGDDALPESLSKLIPEALRSNQGEDVEVEWRETSMVFTIIKKPAGETPPQAGRIPVISLAPELLAGWSRLDSLPVVFYSMPLPGELADEWIGGGVFALTGYPRERHQADKHFWLSCIHPEDLAGVFTGYKRAQLRGMAELEYRWRHADGHYRWMQDRVMLVRDQEGRPLGLQGVRSDITSHKVREELLRESDEFLESVVEGFQAGVCVLDGTMRCLFTNSRFEEMTGIRRTHVVAGRIKLAVHPEELDRTTISVLEAVAGRAARCRSRLCTADGAVTEVEFLMTPLNWKGLRLALALVLEPSLGSGPPVRLT